MRNLLAILLLGCGTMFCSRNDQNQTSCDIEFKYLVVWKYRVTEARRQEFEFEYGPNGTWAKLFNESPKYRRSYLSQSDDNPYQYILIDVWDDKSSYHEFVTGHRKIYDSLSSRFERLYEQEEMICSFSDIPKRQGD